MGPPEAEKDFRPELTELLDEIDKFPIKFPNVNGVTFWTVKSLNRNFTKHSVPLTKKHFEIQKESIKKGDSICTFMVAENEEAVKSSGSGLIYSMGFGTHKFLHNMRQPVSKDTEEFMKHSRFF